MKCKVCDKKTNWDNSVGRPCYIVCNHCVESIAKANNRKFSEITMEILAKGFEIEKKRVDKTL